MKTLILAEKPSQAKLYAQALGGFSSKNGYMENHKYYITWAYGHLIELAKDDTYREKGKWNKSYLPLLPNYNDFKYVPKEDNGVKKQLKIIGELLKDSFQILCATDSDREGELIFRYIYNYLNCKLPFKRIWVSSLQKEEIRKAFDKPKFSQGDTFLENLSKSAYSRALADWIIGVNATQSATLQLGQGKLLSIGRVQTNILKIICERYLKNKNHQKTYTYKIVTEHHYNGVKYMAESQILDTKEKAGELFRNLNTSHFFRSYSSKVEKVSPPLLHTLDSLTIAANKMFKYNASQVLESAQRLYESKLISYPRTEDPYITEEGYEKIKTFLLSLVKGVLGIDFSFSATIPKSVDSSKITGSHDALIPTEEPIDKDTLSDMDRNIYNLILYRCLESFSTEAVFEKGVYIFENNAVPFKTNTNKIIDIGWKKYTPKNDSQEKEDEDTPEDENVSFLLHLPYNQGDKVVVVNKNLKEIESKPPSIYTPASLIADLSNLSKFLKEENPALFEQLSQEIDLRSLQIGTKATRPEQIELLVKKRHFIDFKKNKYTPTPLGLEFYNAIKDTEVVNVAETAKLEYNLKKVSEGQMSETDFYNNISVYTKKIVANILSKGENSMVIPEKKNFGTCPKCNKGVITEGQRAFGCSDWKSGCNFSIWKEVSSKKLTEKNIEDLVIKRKTAYIKGFKSKDGKPFNATLILDNDFKIKFDFNN